MLTFCPECGATLQIGEGPECNRFTCPSCPFVCPIVKKISSRIYPKLKDLDEVLGGPSAWASAQITDERCPTCSQDRAYFMELQTRSADEPATIFYRCANTDCGHRWKDFLIVRRYCYRFRFSDKHTPDFIAGLVSSALFCQLLYLAHESNADHFRDNCPFLFTLFFPCEARVTASYLWKLNVFTVVARLIGDLLKIAAGALGDSAGTFLSRLFGSLPWLLYIPSIVLCSLVILFSTAAFFRYQLSVFGLFTFRPTSFSSPSVARSPKGEEPPPRRSHVMKELYQRCLQKMT